jgi:hypothetical protein
MSQCHVGKPQYQPTQLRKSENSKTPLSPDGKARWLSYTIKPIALFFTVLSFDNVAP